MNKDNLTISVIMTVKNGRNFIERSIKSVIQQTLSPFEIIIVDDGSIDDTKVLVEKLSLETDIPIKFIETGGIGRAKALNLAVKHSCGAWIANLDVDDFWYPQKLEYQKYIIDNNDNIFIVVTNSEILDNQYNIMNEMFLYDNIDEYKILKEKDFYFKNPINHSSVLFNKEYFNKLGSYNETLNKQIDLDLWARFLQTKTSIYIHNSKLTAKVLHPNQSFEAKNRFSFIIGSFKTQNKLLFKINAPWYVFFIPIAKFIFDGLPVNIRNKIKGVTKK